MDEEECFLDDGYVRREWLSERIKKLTRKELLKEYEKGIKTAARTYKRSFKPL